MFDWINFFFAVIEQPLIVLWSSAGAAGLISWFFGFGVLGFLATLVAFPLSLLTLWIVGMLVASCSHDGGPPTANMDDYLKFKDDSLRRAYAGKKIPIGDVYELYMKGKLDFVQDVRETLLLRHKLFRFSLTKENVMFYVRTFLYTNLDHSSGGDFADIAHVYNRGNDFYGWFLGDTMIYTSGIYRDEKDSLEDAQKRKMDTVCQYLQMQPGDRHLDIGCGWGTLLAHSAKYYGTKVTGVTLAKEQADFGRQRAKDYKVEKKVDILVMDYRKIPQQKFDKISCLEMAEHVGIKNFSKFLQQVGGLLEDDGLFYLQIAGLRRKWQWEDLVWGLFMGKYIFPGADASCPLGFVTSQLEKNGFEVHRVENCGVHYATTIKQWYDNWKSNEEPVVKKYGQWWFRLWMIFLSWSSIIAYQGSSTVFMITCNKNLKNDKHSVSKDEAGAQPIDRAARWIGQKPIATQQ